MLSSARGVDASRSNLFLISFKSSSSITALYASPAKTGPYVFTARGGVPGFKVLYLMPTKFFM